MCADKTADAGQQQRIVDRFRHHILYARFQRVQTAFTVCAARDHHHWDRAGLRVAIKSAAQTCGVAIRQGHGRDNKIGCMAQCCDTGLIRCGSLNDFVKGGRQFDF